MYFQKNFKTILFFWLLAIFSNYLWADTNNLTYSKAKLKAATELFGKNECQKVIEALTTKDFTKSLENESDFIEYYRLLGICYFKQKDTRNAEIELNELLFINPDYELDPFITPPPLLEIFGKLKTNVKAKSNELLIAKDKVFEKPNQIEKEMIYYKTSIYPALMPFGIGQFENGEVVKGSLIAASQAVMLGSNIGFYWWKRSLLNAHSTSTNLDQFNLAQTLQFVALGAFAAIYIYGIVDAFLNREDFVLKDTSIKPSELSTQIFLKEFNRAKSNS